MKDSQQFPKMPQPKWQRIVLLIILGYEAIGCLIGGALLVAGPDGRYMKMPVEIMHGFLPNFLIPGIILTGLGVLTTAAFISVLKQRSSDWFITGLALGGLFIWFYVEVIVLRELHWLHAMWGLPVLLGWIMTIPLIAFRHNTTKLHNGLLICGIISSFWYFLIAILVPMNYEGYSSISMTVSELSAIDAPTRIQWVLLAIFYVLLLSAFGWGVQNKNRENLRLRITGSIIIAYCMLNLYWPPMHRREVIASGGGTLTDNLHLVWASLTLIFNIVLMAFGASALGRNFRLYTYGTWIIFIIFGFLTFKESPGIENGLPTPHLGLWERINMSSFLLWIIVFGLALLRDKKDFKTTLNRSAI